MRRSRILGGKSPHAKSAEATGVAYCCGEGRGTEPSHRRLQDGPLEIEPLGERVPRPHRCSPIGCRMAGLHFSNGRGYRVTSQRSDPAIMLVQGSLGTVWRRVVT